jgi:hypothetical protein
MKDYEYFKPNTPIDVYVAHYAPVHKGPEKHDTSEIWVVLSIPGVTSEFGGCVNAGSGYISNPFPANYFGSPENFNKKTLSGVITSVKFMENANGGRSNSSEYASIAAYLADPLVKRLVEKKSTGLNFMQSGNPDKVDAIISFQLVEFPGSSFEVKDTIWDEIIPQDWYDNIFFEEGIQLSSVPVYETADEAIAGSNTQDDIFGNRIFPVMRFHKAELEKFVNHACHFKNHSKPIISGEYGFIGLRSKLNEIYYLHEIYADGGTVLIGKEWDWS